MDSGYVWRKDLRGARDRTGGPALSRWVRRALVALQDGTTVWASMRGRLWKCARKQMREATNHESFGAEFLTLDHLWQLLTDARSQTYENSNPGNTFFPTGKQSARNSARIDEDESDDRDRPVYPLPGPDNMTATTEHSNATTIVAADYPSPTPLSPRRSALPRRRTPSQTSTTVPLPLENSSTRSLTWTRCPSARKNRDLQIPREQRYWNF